MKVLRPVANDYDCIGTPNLPLIGAWNPRKALENRCNRLKQAAGILEDKDSCADKQKIWDEIQKVINNS